MSRRQRVNQLVITGPITLGDLRWLVNEADSDGLLDDSRVELTYVVEVGRNNDHEKITVHGTDSTGKYEERLP